VFSHDELLISVMLYWLTGTAGSSMRYYFERRHAAWAPSHDRAPQVSVPTAVLRFDGDLCFWPRASLAAHFDLRRYTRKPRGGHFAPMERPDAVIADVRAFFRDLR
jgi:pimeloyl-ACP methyl ester carboxylesterase